MEHADERLDDLAASWRRHLKAMGKAPRTIELYAMAVRFYSEWLAAQDRPVTLSSFTRRSVEAWLAGLTETQAPSTVVTRYKGLQQFGRWLEVEGELTESPMRGLPKPAVPETPVPILNEDELARLLKVCTGPTFADRRDEAIVRVFVDCGVRISELAGMAVADVDFDHDVIVVLGKGRRPRATPFGAKTGRALDRYLRLRRQHTNAATAALWLGKRGPLGRDGVDHLLRVRAEAAGIENMHAHRLRHTAAHRWLIAGGQERDLKRIMGWRSDEMLSRYASSTADERALQAHKRLALGDQL